MKPKCRSLSIPVFLNIILLLLLIYTFRIELLTTSMRLSVSIFNQPRLERLLGDYYQNSAALSSNLAHDFYLKALQKEKSALVTSTPHQTALIQFRIGRSYLCGKGTSQNLTEAKHWFDSALKSSQVAAKKGQPIPSELSHEITEAVAQIHSADGKKNIFIPTCLVKSDSELIWDAFFSD